MKDMPVKSFTPIRITVAATNAVQAAFFQISLRGGVGPGTLFMAEV